MSAPLRRRLRAAPGAPASRGTPLRGGRPAPATSTGTRATSTATAPAASRRRPPPRRSPPAAPASATADGPGRCVPEAGPVPYVTGGSASHHPRHPPRARKERRGRRQDAIKNAAVDTGSEAVHAVLCGEPFARSVWLLMTTALAPPHAEAFPGLVGRPLRNSQLGETLLPKRLALPVFCSDPLSSVAYATEEILLILALAGLACFHLPGRRPAPSCSSWSSSSPPTGRPAGPTPRRRCLRRRQREPRPLGRPAAASALLVDYVLTVAVSVVSGVAAITSAFPALSAPRRSPVRRLRGAPDPDEPARRERIGRAFAVPTDGFLLGIYPMFAVAGPARCPARPSARTAHLPVTASTATRASRSSSWRCAPSPPAAPP